MSSHIEVNATVEKERKARCLNCSWNGLEEELVTIPKYLIEKSAGNNLIGADAALAIVKTMVTNLLNELAENVAKNIGLALVDTGFVGLHDKKRLARLIRAGCLGIVRGVLDETDKLQNEAKA
jgi:hypothetical protein